MNYLSDPSAFGYPDETNTGPSGTLTPSGSIVTSANGQTIEDLDITGSVEVAHDNVTITNCRITAPDDAGFPGNKAIVKSDARTGLEIIDTEITCAGPGSYQAVVGDHWIVMRNCHVHHVPEGLRAGSGVDIEFCYFHSIIGNDEEAHSDLIQTTEGIDIRIDTCTLLAFNVDGGDATSAYLCGPDLGDVRNLEFTNNLLDGGGFTLYIGDSDNTIENVTVTGNRWGRNFVFGPWSGLSDGVINYVWDNNVFDDDEEPVPAPEGTIPLPPVLESIRIDDVVGPTVFGVPLVGQPYSKTNPTVLGPHSRLTTVSGVSIPERSVVRGIFGNQFPQVVGPVSSEEVTS